MARKDNEKRERPRRLDKRQDACRILILQSKIADAVADKERSRRLVKRQDACRYPDFVSQNRRRCCSAFPAAKKSRRQERKQRSRGSVGYRATGKVCYAPAGKNGYSFPIKDRCRVTSEVGSDRRAEHPLYKLQVGKPVSNFQFGH